MAGEGGNGKSSDAPEIPIVASITITLNSAGQMSINGPLENRMLCYGLLDMAKDLVYETYKASTERLVQPASSLLPQFPKR
jgi:hypothetical protein